VRRLVVVLGIAGLLAAGCGGGGGGNGGTGASGGGSLATTLATTTAPAQPTGPPLSKAAYQAKLRQISTDIGNRIGRTSSNGKISKADTAKLVTAFHTFADRLAELNPPAAVKQLHARLIKAMNDLGDEFPAIAAKLNKSGKEPSAAIAALFGAHAIQELAKLGAEFQKKGYNLNLNR
jgi:hypothetical protein